MQRLVLRTALLTAALLATYAAASVHRFPTLAELDARAAAQESTVVPDASPTPVESAAPQATATTAPTPTATPAPPTAIASPEPSRTAVASETQTVLSPTVTSTIPTSPTPTTTPVPTPTLTPLTDEPDAPGTITTATIEPSGGQINTPDGRLSIFFPAGAVDEPVAVSIEELDPNQLPLKFDDPIRRAWDLTATDQLGGVSSFSAPVQVTLRIPDGEFGWTIAASTVFWSLDETTGAWTPLADASLSSGIRRVETQLQHFSPYGVSADPSVNLAPFSDATALDLNTGAAQLSIPIEVPLGPAGIKPQLNLNYDSGRVNSMRRDDSLGSWAGVGWMLDLGSVRRVEPYPLHGEAGDSFPWHYALNMQGVSGGLYRPGGGAWFLENHDFTRIELFDDDLLTPGTAEHCRKNLCTWRVTTRDGQQYFFGEVENAARRKCAHYSGGWVSVCDEWEYTGWDLRRIRDISGNEILVTYEQVTAGDRIIDSHPSLITWGGGAFSVAFDTGADSEYVNVDGVLVRQDSQKRCVTSHEYLGDVLETRRLRKITVWVGTSLVRQYGLDYDTQPYNCSGTNPTNPSMRLNSLVERGTQGGELRTMEFEYNQTATVEYIPLEHLDLTHYWPLLSRWKNGLGGSVAFQYSVTAHDPPTLGSPEKYMWSVNVVATKTVDFGTADPAPVVTTLTYDDGPYGGLYDDESMPPPPNTGAYFVFLDRYLGFRTVTETDAAGVSRTHRYHVGGTDNDEILSGREKEVEVRYANETWHKVVNTWSFVVMEPAPHPQQRPRFVFLDRSVEHLRDGTQLATDYTYDTAPPAWGGFGNLIEVHYEGVAGSTADDTYTSTPVLHDPANWVFVPKHEEVRAEGGALLRKTRFYYDGLHDGTTDGGVNLGRLTASELSLTGSQLSMTYHVYDVYGNRIKTSNPTDWVYYGPVGPLGFIFGAPFTTTEYDSAYHALPISVQGPLTTIPPELIAYDELLRPVRSQGSDGHWRRASYDEFGRTVAVWDYLDGDDKGPDNGFPTYAPAFPSRSYSYNWGTVPNSVTTSTRINHGSPDVHQSISCMDGFGRTIDHRSELGASVSRVRTQYDNRGLVATSTNPFWGSGINCTGADDPVTAYDRTSTEYDAAGNATKTYFKPAGNTAGPFAYSETLYQGLTTTYIDEKRHGRTETRSPGANTLTVTEHTGVYPSWAAHATTVYENDTLGQLKKVTDGLGNQTTINYDLAGRKTSMTDPDMGYWRYTYDVAGNLKTQRDAIYGVNAGITTTITYDALNRVTSKSYSNGAPGVSFSYDTYPDLGVCSSSSTTSAKGRVTRMTDAAGQQLFCYDGRGRQINSRRTITGTGAGTFDLARTYNGLGNVVDLTYPDGEVVHHTYTANDGSLVGVCQWDGIVCLSGGNYLSGATLTASGQPSTLALGPGLTTQYQYDYRERVTSITTGSVQSQTLQYDDAGNVTCVGFFHNCTSATGANPEKTTYAYDDLNRLDIMSIGAVVAADYDHNSIGNLTRKIESSAGMQNLSDLTLTYPASGGGAVRPHAAGNVTGTSAGAPLARSFTYDQNGNLLGSGYHATYGFDAENRVATVITSSLDPLFSPSGTGLWCMDVNGSGDIDLMDALRFNQLYPFGAARPSAGPPAYDVTFDMDRTQDIDLMDASREQAAFGQQCTSVQHRYSYDADGTLVRRTSGVPTQPVSSWIIYVGGIFEKKSDGTTTKYYQAFGRSIAMRDANGLRYILADHLGGTVGELHGTTGAKLSDIKYWPYGSIRSQTAAPGTDKLYTGQQKEAGDSGLGLYNYKARFYSTVLGRFVSADPLDSARFAYAGNNPVAYSDPSGYGPVYHAGHDSCQGRTCTMSSPYQPDPDPYSCNANADCVGLHIVASACAVNPSSYICAGHPTTHQPETASAGSTPARPRTTPTPRDPDLDRCGYAECIPVLAGVDAETGEAIVKWIPAPEGTGGCGSVFSCLLRPARGALDKVAETCGNYYAQLSFDAGRASPYAVSVGLGSLTIAAYYAGQAVDPGIGGFFAYEVRLAAWTAHYGKTDWPAASDGLIDLGVDLGDFRGC